MSDKERILAHLQKHGSITPWEAIELFGCTRLGARIWDLKHDGHDIRTTMETGKDRYGEPTRYARYTLHEQK